MKIDYDYIYKVYSDIIDNESIFYLISGTKFIALALLLISWYKKYIESIGGGEGIKIKAPLKAKDIILGLALIAAVISFDKLLNLSDKVLTSIENTYRGFESIPKPTDPFKADLDEDSGISSVMYHLGRIAQDPTYIVLKAAEKIAWFIDTFIYGVFLAERFFFLGILRILGAFALACYSIPELKKWFVNWVSVYVGLYLMIIPFFLVNAFTNAIYMGIYEKAAPKVVTVGGLGLIMTCVLIFTCWIKWRLYKKIHTMVFRIFN